MNERDEPIPLDPWLAASLLQKAIRRGDAERARHAALALHRHRGTGIWRRLTIIAFEDVGIGDLDLVRDVTMCAIDRSVRKPLGPDHEVIATLVQRLAAAPKDRSTDYLICAAKDHPGFDAVRQDIGKLSNDERIAVATDAGQPLVRRAAAMWYCSGVNGGGPHVLSRGDLPRLLHAFDGLGFPHPLSSIVETAARKTREPIAIMLPLLWCLLVESGGGRATQEMSLPPAPIHRGVPLYAYDKHTRLGKRAIGHFIRECGDLRRRLGEFVAEFRHRDVAAMAAFYTDAAPLARRLAWARSEELEALGLEADMRKVGCPREGVEPILDAVRNNLDQLHAIRQRLLSGGPRNLGRPSLFRGRV